MKKTIDAREYWLLEETGVLLPKVVYPTKKHVKREIQLSIREDGWPDMEYTITTFIASAPYKPFNRELNPYDNNEYV